MKSAESPNPKEDVSVDQVRKSLSDELNTLKTCMNGKEFARTIAEFLEKTRVTLFEKCEKIGNALDVDKMFIDKPLANSFENLFYVACMLPIIK